jgi:DNA repair photolyase
VRKVTGRAALSNPEGRFAAVQRERSEDLEDEPARIPVQLTADATRRVINQVRSPDLPFTQSINPYRGCEHGCIYCYARATHAWLDLSPGLDFETRLIFKPDAAERLREELSRPGYRPSPIALGTNTDPYQPVERELGITREILAVLLAHRHPVTVVTKSSLIERDLDLLAELAAQGLASVMVSVTTFDSELKRRMEPRTASGPRRVQIIERLNRQGVPAGVLTAPVIPALNDHELEDMLAAAAGAGAKRAGFVLLRLPHEVAPLFTEWLEAHYPQRAAHVLSLLRQMRGGKINDPRFGTRQRGEGAFADLIAQRFDRACRRLGLNQHVESGLRTDLFQPPPRVKRAARSQRQLDLWSSEPGTQ